MLKNTPFILFGLLSGIILSFFVINHLQSVPSSPLTPSSNTPKTTTREVFGFLPYWNLSIAEPDYSKYITTLNYFSLTIDIDGSILKNVSPVELEPGYYALTGGKADSILETARQNKTKLSLTVFAGDQDSIDKLIENPIVNANNLINDVAPIMSKYGFSDLNLDVEKVGYASPSIQLNYQKFVEEVHNQILSRKLGFTLSSDIIPIDFIRNDRLVYPKNLAKFFDRIILMAYDFHSPSSYVTGPVAPLYGAGSVAEFDTEVAINEALKDYDPSKILLGLPFYGYSWETIDSFPRAAIVPSSAVIESSKDVEDFLSSCNTCTPQFDNVAQEKYIIYKNEETGTYQQIFYPDPESVKSKINFVNGNNLGGLAIWALGYEGNPNSASSILKPLQTFLSNH